MREMKDSGISWVGLMPMSWKKTCVSYVSSSRSGGTPNRDNPQFWEGGTIPWMSSGEVNKEQIWETNEKITQLGSDNSSAKVLHPNSVMVALNGQGKTKGMAAVLKIKAACNQSLCAIHCNDQLLYYQYLYYCFKSMYKYLRSQAGDDVRDGLASSFVIKQMIPIPPRNEQQLISDFLDAKCADIDNILEKTRTSIEEYKRLKQSIITEALQDDGIPQIKLKYLGRFVNGYAFPSSAFTEDGARVLKITDIKPGAISEENVSYVNKSWLEHIPQYIVNKGDVVFALTRPIVNDGIKTAIFSGNEDVLLNQRNAVFKGTTLLDKDYFFFVMQSTPFIKQFKSHIDLTGLQPNISTESISNISIPVPSYERQKQISDELNNKIGMIEGIIRSKQNIIRELENYKKSLIFEYTTGKKEVSI